jgi:hypothetical protein
MIPILPTLSRQGGILAGPLIVSLFSGMGLMIILYPLVMRIRLSAPDRSGLLLAAFLIPAVAGAYRLGVRYKKRRFAAGEKDPLMMRSFMKRCISRDLNRLQRGVETFDGSSRRLFFEMLLSQAEGISRTEGLHLAGINERISSAACEKRKRRLYRRLFQNASEYETAGLPEEITLLKNASVSQKNPFGRSVSELIERRKLLFTLFGDYQNILHAPVGNLCDGPSPPKSAVPPGSSGKIAFVLDLVEILNTLETDRIEPNRKKEIFQLADRRIRMIRTACDRYRETWQRLASAYERMPSEDSG